MTDSPDKDKPRNLRERLHRIGRLTQLLGMVRPYRARFYLATVFLLMGSGLSLAYPAAAGYGVDAIVGNLGQVDEALAKLNGVATLVLGIIVLQLGAVWLRHYLMSWLGERVVADLRGRVFEHLLRLSPGWFHARRSGEIVGRLSNDVTKIEGVIGSELSMALRNMVTLVGGVALLVAQSPQLTLVMLGIVPPLVMGAMLFGRFIARESRKVQDALAESNAHVEEVVAGIQTVQSFVREAYEVGVHGRNVESTFVAGLRLARWRATFMALTSTLGFLALGSILWLGGRQVLAGSMTGGELTAFLMYTMAVATSVATIASLWGSLQRAGGATERVFEILETVPDIQSEPNAVPVPEGGGAITFEHVRFAYPTRPDRLVLDDVSLEVRAGEVLAIVGESGAGKSTLVALAQRFFDAQAGVVRFDGVDVRRLELSALRAKISTVSQEPVLFSGSVLDNIRYAVPTAARQRVEAAARDAYAHAFIASFPDSYDTQVGERGVQLSVGQKQRIAIARAILANPRVLVLDEATSNLDAQSEAEVQRALSRLMQGRTTLVIAHRLSTVKEAHRIVVLRGGKIVEEGTHDALLRARGYYHRLVSHQVIRDESLDVA